MSFLGSKRGLVLTGVVLLLALFLVRPGADRLRARIARSTSLALGRQVDIASVHLRLLPQPGFDLENFVVHDDPAFSAEPMLRAQEVTAVLRVTSLLRGRLEIARLNLSEPSLNLVRNSAGHWNLEELLERAAKTPVAPTSKAKTEARPGFPYIEADRGRINIKLGQEKKAYALTNADFGLWQDSEDAWGMRLKAQPVRTDYNLTDTGTIRVEGTWQRAGTLRQTPLQFSLQWDRGQLGQVSKLFYGSDMGWRGALKFSLALSGTPADLTVTTEASVQDFRRYDIRGGGALSLTAQCNAHYSSVDRSLSNLACRAPVGTGAVTLDGSLNVIPGSGSYDLVLIAQNVPMQSLVALARHAKQDIPDDLVASGKLDANLKLRRSREAFSWAGGGETVGLRLWAKSTKTQLALDRVPFTVSSGAELHGKDVHSQEAPSGIHLDIGPSTLALGRPVPATVQAWISRSGYGLVVKGDAQVQRLLQAARTVGLPAPALAADGTAKVDLRVMGVWAGFLAPQAVGTAQLRAIRVELRELHVPLEIASANLILAPDQIRVQNVTASVAGSAWHGSLLVPRRCADPLTCPVRFDLYADELAADQLSRAFSPQARKRPWYGFLSSSPESGTPFLASLHAIGKLSANRVLIRRLAGGRVSANAGLKEGKLRLSDLRGDVLGGRHTGEWQVDFTAKPPQYSGSGRLERVALAQLADAMHDGWVTGIAGATYRATTSGWTNAELLASADATVQVEAYDGQFPHIALAAGTTALHLHRFAAQLVLREGKVEIQQGKLETGTGIYQVSGTASLGRTLDVKLLHDGGHGFSITGTLMEPRVAPVVIPETRAALKP